MTFSFRHRDVACVNTHIESVSDPQPFLPTKLAKERLFDLSRLRKQGNSIIPTTRGSY